MAGRHPARDLGGEPERRRARTRAAWGALSARRTRAGVVVGVVALALVIALAIALGVELRASPQLRGSRGRAEPCTPGRTPRVHRDRRRRAPFSTAPDLAERRRPERCLPEHGRRRRRGSGDAAAGRRSPAARRRALRAPPPPICAPRSPRAAARRRAARNRAPNPASPTPTRSTISAARSRRRTNRGRRSRCSTNACTSTTSVRRCARNSTARISRCTPRGRTSARAGRARGRTDRTIPPAARRTPTPPLPRRARSDRRTAAAAEHEHRTVERRCRRPGILRPADARRRTGTAEHQRLIGIPA